MSSELKAMFVLLIGQIALSFAVSKDVALRQSVSLCLLTFDARLEQAVKGLMPEAVA